MCLPQDGLQKSWKDERYRLRELQYLKVEMNGTGFPDWKRASNCLTGVGISAKDSKCDDGMRCLPCRPIQGNRELTTLYGHECAVPFT